MNASSEGPLSPPPVSVIIPTYRRPESLARCLEGLAHQTMTDFEAIVVVRDTDSATMGALPTLPRQPHRTRKVTVGLPGVIAAMAAGLDAAHGDIVAIIDDDAVPHPDWLERIIGTFANGPDVAGVGGKDDLYRGGVLVEGAATVVGVLQWWGRHIGNHHLGSGGPREVDILKGANCAFRTDILRRTGFDTRLRGTGAQVHWELSLCLTIRRTGYRLIYDPAIRVEHHPAARFDEDQREGFNYEARYNESFNETLALLDHLGYAQRAVFMIWSVAIGTRAVPGLLQWARLSLKQRRSQHQRMRAAIKGRLDGWRYWLGRRRPDDRSGPYPIS